MKKAITHYEVTAQAQDAKTGRPTSPQRSEIISLDESVFRGCDGAQEVKRRYEQFWNRPGALEKVKVLSVWPATQAQDDAPRPDPNAGKGARSVFAEPAKASTPKVKPSAQRRLERRAMQRAGHESAMQA